MTVTVEIPEDLAGMIATGNAGLSRAVLEAVTLEGYWTDRLSEEGVRRLMGFETRMEVHGFLKEHGVYLHYTVDDLEQDTTVARDVALRYKHGG